MQNILLEGFDKNIFGKVLHYKQLLAYTNFDANCPGMFTTQLQLKGNHALTSRQLLVYLKSVKHVVKGTLGTSSFPGI